MSKNLGIEGAQAPPPAVRSATPGWRDPRLWVGIVIVAASVVGGARLMASADDTVSVWAATSDMGSGDRVDEEDLVVRRVRFADGADLDRYFSIGDTLPADLELVRGVGEGELLPRAAVGSTEDSDNLEISIEVEPGQVPTSVEAGAVVDVFLVDPTARGTRGTTDSTGAAALASVTVVDAPRVEESFATNGKRQLVLAVPEEEVEEFYGVLGTLDDPLISIVRRS